MCFFERSLSRPIYVVPQVPLQTTCSGRVIPGQNRWRFLDFLPRFQSVRSIPRRYRAVPRYNEHHNL